MATKKKVKNTKTVRKPDVEMAWCSKLANAMSNAQQPLQPVQSPPERPTKPFSTSLNIQPDGTLSFHFDFHGFTV